MGAAVWAAPPASLLVSQGSVFLGALASLPCCQSLDVPVGFLNEFMHGFYGCIIGFRVVGLLCHLSYQVFVGVSEVSHCRPVFCRCLIKVSEVFLDAHQVVGSVAALE